MTRNWHQISGINLITYYIPTILQNQVRLSGFLSRLIAACNGTEYFAASWIAVFTIERFGRRGLMIFGSIGMTLSMVILAITDHIGSSTTGSASTNAGIASTVMLFAFNSFFAVGWLGMTWLYPAEIVPLRIRAPANAVSTSGNWIWNFMVIVFGTGLLIAPIANVLTQVVMITPVSFSSIGYKTYIIFAVMYVKGSVISRALKLIPYSNGAVILPTVYFFYPETANRSLEEMDLIFRKTKSIWTAVDIANKEPKRYGKHGELLITTDELDDARLRQASVVSGSAEKGGFVEREEA